MLSNFSSINIVNQKYLNKDIDIYKDTVKTMLKIQKNINQLKNHNNSNPESDIISFQSDNSFEESLILLEIMKKELEKNILKKYNIINEEVQENIDNKKNDYNNSIIKNNISDNQAVFIKKNFKSI